MKKVIQELLEITSAYSKKIAEIPDAEFSAKPLPHKWSKKEVLGHLIDSAQNNIRRFICAQHTADPPQIVYDQEFWVAANNYGHAAKEDIILHWRLINESICRVLGSMPEIHYQKMCNTSKDGISLRSLEWLAEDYVKHLKHHLNQIIPNAFDITYP